MSQSVCAIKYSARCEPTMPVMPVISARVPLTAIVGSLTARLCSQQSALMQKIANPLGDVAAPVVVDRLVIAKGEGVRHDPARMRQIADHPVRVHLHRRLPRDIAANDGARLDCRTVEMIG